MQLILSISHPHWISFTTLSLFGIPGVMNEYLSLFPITTLAYDMTLTTDTTRLASLCLGGNDVVFYFLPTFFPTHRYMNGTCV